MKKLFALTMICCVLLFIQNGSAQNSKDKRKQVPENQVRMDSVKAICKDIPLEKRIRVTVSRFTSTAGNSPRELGENMSTMLSNALSQVNCFNVLEEQKHMDDLKGEVDAANSEYSDAATGIEKGKMKIAQIIVTGEVTEYNDASDVVSVFGIGTENRSAKIGFILKIINPRTREIIKSTSFNVESNKGGSASVSIFSHRENSNPAIADALEKGIIQATEYLASQKDNIPLPSEEELNSSFTVVTVSNVTFSQKSNTLEILKNIAGVKKAELSSFSNNTAVYAVRHDGSTDELATIIDQKYAARFEITGTQSGKIFMKFK